ncbi:MAG: sugar phosphate isomerase/epimerase [Candidatus Hydrogenedentes bacterium]|nr:sugar phosphate isomerase/epimerase [Candidatus Hydrogenedentota bacterium]
MKLGLLTAMFGDKPLKQVLEIIRPLGLDTVELGTGNYPGGPHAPLKELLGSKPKREELLALIKGEGLEISALSCHGNCLHPNKAFAKKNQDVQTDTIKLAELLGVKTIIDFSGCPGSDPKAEQPNWVTCAWPPEYLDILDYQWNKVVIPYWTKQAKFAKDHGVRVAFEAHPGFVVYNTETLLKLRKECGKNLGANFDPSHFFWQGMEPIECVKALGGDAIFHVHAKDSKVDPVNAAVNGVLDTKHYGLEAQRSWVFRTCGYGHSLEWWKDFFSTLRLVGYDGPISIEHEDSLMSSQEGLTKAVEFLKQCIITQKRGAMTWA